MNYGLERLGWGLRDGLGGREGHGAAPRLLGLRERLQRLGWGLRDGRGARWAGRSTPRLLGLHERLQRLGWGLRDGRGGRGGHGATPLLLGLTAAGAARWATQRLLGLRDGRRNGCWGCSMGYGRDATAAGAAG